MRHASPSACSRETASDFGIGSVLALPKPCSVHAVARTIGGRRAESSLIGPSCEASDPLQAEWPVVNVARSRLLSDHHAKRAEIAHGGPPRFENADEVARI